MQITGGCWDVLVSLTADGVAAGAQGSNDARRLLVLTCCDTGGACQDSAGNR